MKSTAAHPERLLWLYSIFDEDVPELIGVTQVPLSDRPESVNLNQGRKQAISIC